MTAGSKHWLKQKSVWATLVAVTLAGAAMGSAITFFADAQAAKRHTALLDNMKRYQALAGSHQVITQRILCARIALDCYICCCWWICMPRVQAA